MEVVQELCLRYGAKANIRDEVFIDILCHYIGAKPCITLHYMLVYVCSTMMADSESHSLMYSYCRRGTLPCTSLQ